MFNNNKIFKKLIYIVLGACFLVSGCARFQLGDQASGRNPTEKPVYNFTSFSDSLECMDHLMMVTDPPNISITAQDIRNHTADMTQPVAGMKDMLISSISKMSERSKKVTFVAYGSDIRDILLLHKAHSKNSEFVVPDLFIRGGVTQMDRNVVMSRLGLGLSHEDWNAAYSGGQAISFVALDLNVGNIKDLTILPSAGSSNVLALYDRGFGNELGGRINTIGTVFDFGVDRRDGLGQAIRNLVDLGVIESVGKLLELPYMACLPLNYDDPDTEVMIEKEYYRFRAKPVNLVKAIQFKLKEYDYYSGEVHGKLDHNTLLAISYFKNLYDLPKNEPLITVNLYKKLMYGRRFEWPSLFMKKNSHLKAVIPMQSESSHHSISKSRKQDDGFQLIEDML